MSVLTLTAPENHPGTCKNPEESIPIPVLDNWASQILGFGPGQEPCRRAPASPSTAGAAQRPEEDPGSMAAVTDSAGSNRRAGDSVLHDCLQTALPHRGG